MKEKSNNLNEKEKRKKGERQSVKEKSVLVL